MPQFCCSEMSAASETLARDNCTVSDELVQLREDKASHTHNMNALQVRAKCKMPSLPFYASMLCVVTQIHDLSVLYRCFGLQLAG